MKTKSMFKRDLRKSKMRLRFGDHYIGFWWGKTADGFSMGPAISSEEHVHLTYYVKNGFINSHLKLIEQGRVSYKNLVTMSINNFQRQIRQVALNLLASIGYADLDQTAILLTKRGIRRFQTFFSDSTRISYKGKTEHVDLDIGILLDEMRTLSENISDYIILGRARDLINPNYAFGITEEGCSLFQSHKQIISLKSIYENNNSNFGVNGESLEIFGSLENLIGKPFYDLISVTGIPQLLNEIERRKIFERYMKKNRADILSWFSNQNWKTI